MARKIVNGVQLTQQCWRALKQNPQLLFFPLLSGLTLVLVSVVFLGPMIGGTLLLHGGQLPAQAELTTLEWIILVLLSFLFYFASNMVIIFSNTALIGASMKLLRGESATVRDGIVIAQNRLKQVVGFALISATIGTLAQMGRNASRDSDSAIASILVGFLGGLKRLNDSGQSANTPTPQLQHTAVL